MKQRTQRSYAPNYLLNVSLRDGSRPMSNLLAPLISRTCLFEYKDISLFSFVGVDFFASSSTARNEWLEFLLGMCLNLIGENMLRKTLFPHTLSNLHWMLSDSSLLFSHMKSCHSMQTPISPQPSTICLLHSNWCPNLIFSSILSVELTISLMSPNQNHIPFVGLKLLMSCQVSFFLWSSRYL